MTIQFREKEFTFTQPDGSQITVKGWGDQFHAVFETPDGFTVVKDPVTGFYQYASLAEDGNDLRPTGANVGQVDPRNLNLRMHTRINRAAEKEKALVSYFQMGTPRRWEIRRQRKRERLAAALRGIGPLAARGQKLRRP